MSGISVDVRVNTDTRMVKGKLDRVQALILDRLPGQTIQFARRSMRPVPSGKNIPQYNQRIATFYKSGAKKGQPRNYVKRGRHSAPGTPPNYHGRRKSKTTGQVFNDGLRKMNKAMLSKSLAIAGPVYFKSFGNMTQSEPVPHIQEFGGTFRKTYKLSSKKKTKSRGWGPPRTKSDFKRIAAAKRKPQYVPAKTVRESNSYPARPYMAPAAKKAAAWLRRNGSRLARNA